MQVTRSGSVAAGNPSVPGSTLTSSLRYFHHDQLGSIAAISDEAGKVIERLAYDPWGKRRNTNGPSDVSDSLIGLTTDRGFTMHEHLDEMGIIHMNGRLYDPLIGRFMSADPFIQAPGNLPSYNRYAYVMNNPLNLTDPSGYLSLRSVVKIVVIAVISYYTAGAVSGWMTAAGTSSGSAFAVVSGGTALSSTGISLSTLGGIVSGAAGGFVGGALSTGTLRGGVQGAFTGGVFGGIGATGAGNGWGTGEYVAAHAAGGCITSVTGGGNCGSGAASGAFGKFTTIAIGDMQGDFAKGVATVVAGGVGSVVAGGKFENGAVTAAYGYLFNYLGSVHSRMSANSMRDAGGGNVLSVVFGDIVAAVDVGTQGKEYSDIHSMCSGNWSSTECALKTTDFKEKMWGRKDVTGLAGLMHQMQDSFAPMHAGGQKYEGFPWYRLDQWMPHAFSDRMPSAAVRDQIVQRGTQLIRDYNRHCGGCALKGN
jgi:RHS repeat-associated protein